MPLAQTAAWFAADTEPPARRVRARGGRRAGRRGGGCERAAGARSAARRAAGGSGAALRLEITGRRAKTLYALARSNAGRGFAGRRDARARAGRARRRSAYNRGSHEERPDAIDYLIRPTTGNCMCATTPRSTRWCPHRSPLRPGADHANPEAAGHHHRAGARLPRAHPRRGARVGFEPLMSLYLTDNLSPDEIDPRPRAGTSSPASSIRRARPRTPTPGVTAIDKIIRVSNMEKLGMVLCACMARPPGRRLTCSTASASSSSARCRRWCGASPG